MRYFNSSLLSLSYYMCISVCIYVHMYSLANILIICTKSHNNCHHEYRVFLTLIALSEEEKIAYCVQTIRHWTALMRKYIQILYTYVYVYCLHGIYSATYVHMFVSTICLATSTNPFMTYYGLWTPQTADSSHLNTHCGKWQTKPNQDEMKKAVAVVVVK